MISLHPWQSLNGLARSEPLTTAAARALPRSSFCDPPKQLTRSVSPSEEKSRKQTDESRNNYVYSMGY
jgi:hypothetical protein